MSKFFTVQNQDNQEFGDFPLTNASGHISTSGLGLELHDLDIQNFENTTEQNRHVKIHKLIHSYKTT